MDSNLDFMLALQAWNACLESWLGLQEACNAVWDCRHGQQMIGMNVWISALECMYGLQAPTGYLSLVKKINIPEQTLAF